MSLQVPPATPADFLEATRPGEGLEVWWEDAWWVATLERERETHAARVDAVRIKLQAEPACGTRVQVVPSHRLRPGWQWQASEQGGRWGAPCIADA